MSTGWRGYSVAVGGPFIASTPFDFTIGAVGECDAELEVLQDPLAWLIDAREPDAHKDVLSRPELVVPIIGSGISLPLGYPGSAGLAAELVAIGRTAGIGEEDLALADPRSIADVLIARGAIEREELLHRVAGLYSGAPTGTSEVVDHLLGVRSQVVLTLNYDPSLETRAGELDIEFESLVLASNGARVVELLAEPADRPHLAIVHAHGTATNHLSIVLDRHGYSGLLNAPHIDFLLRLLTTTRRLLFMGTSLDELHFLSRLSELEIIHKRHLFVGSRETIAALRSAPRAPLIPETYLLVMRAYDDHADLVPLVALLGPARGGEPAVPAEAGPVFPTVDQAAPDAYVETLMLERREVRDDEIDASFLFALGTLSPLTLEQIAAEGARTVIEGLPGSGKSTFLVEIGRRQPEGVVALWLRAPELEFVGDASLLLQRWLEEASAFRDGEARDPQRLGVELFHFLIDGLDEVPYPQQELAAQRIAEVAAANPTHSFTVASRAIPSLERLGRPEWVHVTLAPTRSWREAYLEKRGVSWERLIEASPLLGDLRELLDLPFFLSQTVDLYEQGQLAEAADLLTLVTRFVDAGLREIDETIPAAVVRHWLRRLALGMVLAGRIEVSVEETATSLPDELAKLGGAVTVAEKLVSARLFRASGDRTYGFVHRIFGEVLAAEAVLEFEPEEFALLDVAAPLVTDRIRGLRSDWLVPMTIVATASSEWRRALEARDPLAAARATPIDAPTEERQQAA